MKRMELWALCLVLMVCLIGCAGGGKDRSGEYQAESPKDEYGNSAELTLTLGEDGTIDSVEWKEYANGTLKDKEYGKNLGDDQYELAQKALSGSATYPNQLLKSQDIGKVEAVSGATQSYDRFVRLYHKAMEEKK